MRWPAGQRRRRERQQPDDEHAAAAEYDRKLAELRAERERLQSLPSVPDRWDTIDTGETVGERWPRPAFDGRRTMLREICKVYAEPFKVEGMP